MKINRFTKD